MNCRLFKYDVAFSFLKGDEDLVSRIDTLLQDRFKTFVPSRREEFIAHTDFERTVHRVFAFEARIVTVLYRDSWGRTGCTLAGGDRHSESGTRRRIRLHPPHPCRHPPFPSPVDTQETNLAGS